MNLTEIIKIASEAYDADGTVMQCHLNPDEDHGDTLAKFIALELAETYNEEQTDAMQLNTASDTIGKASTELEAIYDAFDVKWTRC